MEDIKKEAEVLSDSKLEEVSGGAEGGTVVEHGVGKFKCDCPSGSHTAVFNYEIVRYGNKTRQTHVTGKCSVCGMYNNYWFLGTK